MSDGIAGLRRMALSVSTWLEWLSPTVARVTVGWVFVQSGWKAFSIMPKVVAYFTKLGIPAPRSLAPFVAATELLCGALLLLGLCTRLGSLPLIVTMIVALVTAKKSEIHELSDLFGLSEYLYVALLLWLGAYGAGPVSLDRVFARRL